MTIAALIVSAGVCWQFSPCWQAAGVIDQERPAVCLLCATALMTHPLQDPEHWRQRAADMRKIAEGMAHLSLAQASLLETAEEYERRAAEAEKHRDLK